MPGLFISFEGIDGCGKSTQMRRLAAELRARGHDVVTTREPGGTPLGERLRDVLLDHGGQVDPLAELLVFAADRAQHVRTLVRPALDAGRVVLTDRYADSTVAYQGAGRGFPDSLIAQVVSLATGGLMPDLTLVFDLPVEEGRRRAQARSGPAGSPNRLDAEDAAFYTRVRDSYLRIAAAEPERFRVVDASGPAQETHAEVLRLVRPLLETRCERDGG